jgi:hypothetical protein
MACQIGALLAAPDRQKQLPVLFVATLPLPLPLPLPILPQPPLLMLLGLLPLHFKAMRVSCCIASHLQQSAARQ